MVGRRVILQVLAFALVAVVGISVVAVQYVRVPELLGRDGYVVTLEMPSSGGAYVDAMVAYRGVSVGRVEDLSLTDDAVEARLRIRGDAPRIPRNLSVQVANRSALGEQFVDLRPESDDGPWLGEGDRLTVASADLPLPVEDLLTDVDSLVSSVPRDSLTRVVDELDRATRGSGDDLQKLLDTSRDVTRAFDESFPVTQQLIDSSGQVLATQQTSAQDITDFSASLRLLAGQLQDSDSDLRSLIAATPGAAQQFQGLVQDVGLPLGLLIGNLVTTAQVFSANADGLQGLYVRMPQAVSATYDVARPDGLRVGLVTSFFQPLPCTQGYAGDQRPPEDLAPRALDTGAGCTSGAIPRGASAAAAAATSSASTGPASAAGASVGTVNQVTTLADLMGGRS